MMIKCPFCKMNYSIYSIMHNRKSFYLIVTLIMTTSLSFGQSLQNFGLTSKQDKSTLPKSAVVTETPVRNG